HLRAHTRMLPHGLGNAAILTTALGVTLWRSRRRASWVTAGLGLLATAAACVTGYLGGEMVYSGRGGVEALGAPRGWGARPPLFSSRGLSALLRDAGQGAAWLARNAGQAFRADESAAR